MLTVNCPTTLDALSSNKTISETYTDPLLAYRSLHVIKKLSNTKFPVFLVCSKINKQYYAMKVFPFVDEHPHYHFYNELRFTFLRHSHIVNFVHCEKEKGAAQKEELHKVSYILMDYAFNGDFFNFVIKHRAQLTEKLARTYFRQLIDGIECLHKAGVAHLDLKPENLLIGDDFKLKIIDFDRSYVQGDQKIISKGTKFYRAPEYFRPGSDLSMPFAADIYSAGVILFILKSGGVYPHGEDDTVDNGRFLDLMYNNNEKFWERHYEMEKRTSYFYGRNFKELFNRMVSENPRDRPSIAEIKQSRWYNGPVYSSQELCKKMEEILNDTEEFIESS